MIHNKLDLKIPAGREIVEATLIRSPGAKGVVCLLMAARTKSISGKAGPTGIEPATPGLKVRCSSLTELRTPT